MAKHKWSRKLNDLLPNEDILDSDTGEPICFKWQRLNRHPQQTLVSDCGGAAKHPEGEDISDEECEICFQHSGWTKSKWLVPSMLSPALYLDYRGGYHAPRP